jgi:hypothetical protein
MYFISVVLVLFLGAGQSYAQAWVPSAKADRKDTSVTLDSGASQYDKDLYFHLSPNITYNWSENFGMSFSLPLNLVAVDNEPISEDLKIGQPRPFDYNERSDFFRAINYIWYGKYEREVPGRWTSSFFAGDIRDGRIGHGTIVNQYYNNIRHDTYQTGILADINSDYGGVQVFVNSVYSRDVNAARVFIKPLAIGRKAVQLYQFFQDNIWIDEEDEYIGMMQIRGKVLDEAGRKSVLEEAGGNKRNKKPLPNPTAKYSKMEIHEKDEWYNRLTIGITRAFDGNTPLQFQYSQNGIPERRDNRDLPVVTESGRVSVDGYDIEYRLLNMKWVEFTPYLDVNRIRELENSGGTHYGFMARFGDSDVNLIIKPELRRMSKNYIPMYFDTFYEVERFHGNLSSQDPMRPKLTDAQGLETTGGIRGSMFTVLFNFYQFGFEASYENYEGENNSRIFLASYIPLGSNLNLSFFYTKKGFNGTGEAFRIDNATLGAAELSFPISNFMIRVQNIRRWTLNEGDRGFTSYDEQRLLLTSSFLF